MQIYTFLFVNSCKFYYFLKVDFFSEGVLPSAEIFVLPIRILNHTLTKTKTFFCEKHC